MVVVEASSRSSAPKPKSLYGFYLGLLLLVLAVAFGVLVPLWLSVAAFDDFYLNTSNVALRAYSLAFGVQMTLEAWTVGFGLSGTSGVLAILLKMHCCDVELRLRELGLLGAVGAAELSRQEALSRNSGTGSLGMDTKHLQLIDLWISRYQASKGAMQQTAHEVRWLIAATGFYAGVALGLTFLELATAGERVAHWPLAKTFNVCVLLVLSYLLFLNCLFWMATISDRYDRLSEVANASCALTLHPTAFGKLTAFTAGELAAGAGWHLFEFRIDKRLFVAGVVSGTGCLLSIARLLADMGLFDLEGNRVFDLS